MFLVPALLVAATFGPASSAPDTAYTGISPIKIQTCSVDTTLATVNSGEAVSFQPMASGLRISFVNEAPKPIASVSFTVEDSGGTIHRVVDVGTFSPGITIAHAYNAPVSNIGDVTCNVSAVAFADGESWTPPAVASANRF